VRQYVDFVLTFALSFGLFFELPLVLLLLIKLGVLTPRALGKYRKYAVFFIILGAVIISPTPELWTLAMMIVPVYALYEMSIWIGKLMVYRKNRREVREHEAG
jgi:sec-independent protein translocase protein TatC